MRRLGLLAVLSLALVVIAPNHASAQARHDGHTWLSLSRELKISYIQGLIDGSALGVMLAKENMAENDACQSKLIPAYTKAFQNLLAEVSPSQIADGVDTVFKDYRNRSLLMTDAVYVTLRTISGTSPEDIEKLLQVVRAAPK
jgi:hypothetical protein